MITPATLQENHTKVNPLVDEWIPEPQDILFTNCKGAFIAPISDILHIDRNGPNADIDYFMLTSKRCYASDNMKDHTCHYLNYFEKFYDPEKELFMIYSKMKPLIDYEPSYSKENFLYDIKKYILSPSMLWKVKCMDEDNYYINLTYKNNNSAICYTNKHAKLLMRISILMNMIIPLMCHYMYIRSMQQDDGFILSICDMLLDIPIYSDIDLYNKLYETATTNVNTSYKRDTGLWEQQDIRGKNTTTHAIFCIENILINVLPKYVYNKNIVNLNFGSINNSNEYQVTNISWEYGFIPLSSSNRDEDNNSEFDKFEALQIRADESLYIQNKVNCEATMKQIEYLYGPFDDEEVDFYYKALDGKINNFQKVLVFNLFYKYFGDPTSIKSINMTQYIKLVIAARRMLEGHNLRILPYIISGKVVKLIKKKNINKKELMKLRRSLYFDFIEKKYTGEISPKDEQMYIDLLNDIDEFVDKYDSLENIVGDGMIQQILSLIATLSISTFKIIDFYDDELNGTIIETIPAILQEEVLMFISLI